MSKRVFIKDLRPGNLFVMVPNTVYRAVRVTRGAGKTTVSYTVVGSHFTQETEFTRPGLTTCELV